MKTICIIQPYVFPYLPYFQLAAAVDEFWIFDDVQYIRRGWMNRNYLLNNGQRQLFTLPVEKGQQSDLIKDKRLPEEFAASLGRLTKAFQNNYACAPYRDDVLAILDNLRASRWTLFADFAAASLRLVFERLGIKTQMHRTSTLDLPGDLRGANRIMEICHHVRAGRYVNPIGGTALYNVGKFANEQIELKFLKGEMQPYGQGSAAEFVAGMSILDLLAWIAPQDYASQLHTFELV